MWKIIEVPSGAHYLKISRIVRKTTVKGYRISELFLVSERVFFLYKKTNLSGTAEFNPSSHYIHETRGFFYDLTQISDLLVGQTQPIPQLKLARILTATVAWFLVCKHVKSKDIIIKSPIW